LGHQGRFSAQSSEVEIGRLLEAVPVLVDSVSAAEDTGLVAGIQTGALARAGP
jgi:hypothetical protein